MPDCVARSLVIVAVALGGLVVAPSAAEASDGYEIGFAAAGATLPTVGLDITFIVATATGLTYRDDGWAIAEIVWGLGSLAGCGIAMGYSLDRGYDGLTGALALQGIGSSIYAIYGLVGLDEGERPDVNLAVAPTAGGATLWAGGVF